MPKPTDHVVHIEDLAARARASVHIYSDGTRLVLYEHRYLRRDPEDPRPRADVDCVCDTKLYLRYDERGALYNEVEATLHVILPKRLGKRYLYGADVSPGAKTFFQFTYRQGPDGTYRLGRIRIGAFKRLDLDDLPPETFVRPTDFPFPVPDRLDDPDEGGGLWFPYLARNARDDDDEVLRFYVSRSIARCSSENASAAGE